INYEPTGLTLKFTPQVFTNLDVQVKMSIESKDVLGARTLTPTFTERSITGTARVQNNRTMMLASVAQDVQSSGRAGLPLLGLIPVLGRLFTSPTRENRRVDIVIAVTPRVLRAPAVTPRDEEMRPSGTLQSPTTGSLEAMIIESDREDQIAAARRLPRNAVVTVSNVEPPPFSPVQMSTTAALKPAASSNLNTTAGNTVSTEKATQTIAAQPKSVSPQAAEELPTFVPAPKSLVSQKSASDLATVNSGGAGTQNAVLTSLPKPIDTGVSSTTNGRRVQLSLAPASEVMKVGDKRRFAIELNSAVPLNLAVLGLKFNPSVMRITQVSYGTFFPIGKAPNMTQYMDPKGMWLISISPNSLMKGSGALVFIQVEAIAAGEAGLTLDKRTMHVVAGDAQDVIVDLVQGLTTVTK
ncbi:MAG: hypothetical protein ACREBC_19550, partial [Pyrinomonadaceae bacterium]